MHPHERDIGAGFRTQRHNREVTNTHLQLPDSMTFCWGPTNMVIAINEQTMSAKCKPVK
jgi:hypothetical protein